MSPTCGIRATNGTSGSSTGANPLNQGATAGRNAVGQLEAYTRLPYFFSDQYDVGLEYVGHAGSDDAITVRGDLASRPVHGVLASSRGR